MILVFSTKFIESFTKIEGWSSYLQHIESPQASDFNKILAQTYPDARCELDFTNPLELLVATVLSAQCTDKRVNQVTPALFLRYPTAQAYADAAPLELEEIIRTTGFQRTKTKNLILLGQKLVRDYGGQVPGTLSELITLAGVGRKTANVVLGNAFGVPGLTVDTHFARLVKRFGLTTSTDAVKIEREIGELLPAAEWTPFSHRVIFHGRRICHSRKPECEICPLRHICPSSNHLNVT